MNEELFKSIPALNFFNNHTKKRNDLIETGKIRAIESIKNFCTLLNINPEIFNHIYQIPVKIEDFLGINAEGFYYIMENYIALNSNTIEKSLKRIDENPDDEKVKNVEISLIATLIVHEMLHANRSIIIENGLDKFNLIEKGKKETTKYLQEQEGYDLDQYDSLLHEVLQKTYIEEFKKFIPIKAKLNEDGSYTIVAYNLETKDYAIFANQQFKAKMEDGIDKFLYQLALELNDENEKHVVTKEIYTNTNNNDELEGRNINDYYHPYSESGRLVDQSNMESKNLSKEEYDKLIVAKQSIALKKINDSEGIEEALVETLAQIIVMTRNSKELELDKITTRIYDNNEYDIKMAAKLIQKMGVDVIRWFLTSVYEDYYSDELEKTFQERYDELIIAFNELYDFSKKCDNSDSILEYYKASVNENIINSLIEEKVGRKR